MNVKQIKQNKKRSWPFSKPPKRQPLITYPGDTTLGSVRARAHSKVPSIPAEAPTRPSFFPSTGSASHGARSTSTSTHPGRSPLLSLHVHPHVHSQLPVADRVKVGIGPRLSVCSALPCQHPPWSIIRKTYVLTEYREGFVEVYKSPAVAITNTARHQCQTRSVHKSTLRIQDVMNCAPVSKIQDYISSVALSHGSHLPSITLHASPDWSSHLLPQTRPSNKVHFRNYYPETQATWARSIFPFYQAGSRE